MDFETGEKAQLISGGPTMVVIGIVGTQMLTTNENNMLKAKGAVDGDIYCDWTAEGQIETGAFKAGELRKL